MQFNETANAVFIYRSEKFDLRTSTDGKAGLYLLGKCLVPEKCPPTQCDEFRFSEKQGYDSSENSWSVSNHHVG